MPWVPELFSAPVLARFEAKQQRKVVDIPYFDGLLAGDTDALVESFAGEPRLHHPLRGSIEGEQAFREFVADTDRWLREREATVEDVQRSVLPDRGFEEVVVHLETPDGHVELPHAMVADHTAEGRIEEIRVYFGTRALTGHPTERAPLLRPGSELRLPTVVGRYAEALGSGDVEGVVAAFEADGRVREPGGADLVHAGAAALRGFYGAQLSGGGIGLDPCAVVESGDVCALEHIARRPGPSSPRAGFTVFVSGTDDRLAAVRIYDEL
jgi:ketosteroid isomerase-like protein